MNDTDSQEVVYDEDAESEYIGSISNGSLTYDAATDTYVADFETTSASVAVAKALADLQSCRVTALDPLYETLDPDALDRLVESGDDSVSVSFSIDGITVVLTGDGRIELTLVE